MLREWLDFSLSFFAFPLSSFPNDLISSFVLFTAWKWDRFKTFDFFKIFSLNQICSINQCSILLNMAAAVAWQTKEYSLKNRQALYGEMLLVVNLLGTLVPESHIRWVSGTALRQTLSPRLEGTEDCRETDKPPSNLVAEFWRVTEMFIFHQDLLVSLKCIYNLYSHWCHQVGHCW